VIPVRMRLPAVATVAAILVSLGAPLCANAPLHRVCAANQHVCGNKTTELKARCCLEPSSRPDDATPATGKTRVAQPVADGTIVVSSAPPALPGLLRHARALTTAPRSSPPDLVTLFRTFLI